MNRVYVDVDCQSLGNGVVKPLKIHWRDGRAWKITRVLHSSYSDDNEFDGVRYTVLIGDAEKYLYRFEDKWYVILDTKTEANDEKLCVG